MVQVPKYLSDRWEDAEDNRLVGKLQIEKINIVLPVIAYTDDEALKVSVCYYDGSLPGTKGNLIITGHNYASGAHFGRLDELDIGDIISLSTPDERMYHYQCQTQHKNTNSYHAACIICFFTYYILHCA